jgi:hypothetical protein
LCSQAAANAFRGGCADHADVDSLAHTLVAAFQQAMRRSEPKICGYRAYRIADGERDVRLRVMAQDRLLRLGLAMEGGRSLVLEQRSARVRAAA